MNRRYNSGNAYKYDYDYSEAERIRKTEIYMPNKISNNTNNSKYVKKAQIQRKKMQAYRNAVNFERILASVIRTAAVFIIAGMLVYRYVLITELNMTANKLKNEYTAIVAENQELRNDIDSAVDLKKLQDTATSRLGMVRPNSDQIFYIESDNNSYGEKVNNKKFKTGSNRSDSADSDESSFNAVIGSIVKSVKDK